MAINPPDFGPFDSGAPRLPETLSPRTGNIDEDFDDFSPNNTATALGSVHAFQLVKVAVDDLCVRQGSINSTIPTISGTELSPDFSENSLNLLGTGTLEYWLNITIDTNGDITAITIDTTEPGANSATQAKLLLGSVETDSGDIVAFNSNLSGSQSLASCGSTHYFGLV